MDERAARGGAHLGRHRGAQLPDRHTVDQSLLGAALADERTKLGLVDDRDAHRAAGVRHRCFYQIWWIIHFPLSDAEIKDPRAYDLCDEHMCAFRPSTTFGLFVPLLTK